MNETCFEAVQLADWLLRLGFNVTMMANGRINRIGHEHWDSRVLSRQNPARLHSWVNKQKYVCWFEIDDDAMPAICRSRHIKLETCHVCFPRNSMTHLMTTVMGWDNSKIAFISRKPEHYIGTDKTTGYWQRAFVLGSVSPSTLIDFHVATAGIHRHLLVVIQRNMKNRIPVSVTLKSVEHVLDHTSSDVSVSFLVEAGLGHKEQLQLANMAKCYSDRVVVYSKPTSYGLYKVLGLKSRYVYLTHLDGSSSPALSLFRGTGSITLHHTPASDNDLKCATRESGHWRLLLTEELKKGEASASSYLSESLLRAVTRYEYYQKLDQQSALEQESKKQKRYPEQLLRLFSA